MIMPTDSSDVVFGWIKFYMEFADKLLEHKDDRRGLTAKVREVCRSVGFRYLENPANWGDANELQDISPFTVIGAFTRGGGMWGNANCQTVAAELRDYLQVTQPVPHPSDCELNIPMLPYNYSVVGMDFNEIDSLWQLFVDAIQLADSSNARNSEAFAASYDIALGLGLFITNELYWIRPYKYLPVSEVLGYMGYLDAPRSTFNWLSNWLTEYAENFMDVSGKEYLQFIDGCSERFRDPDVPVHSFPELVAAVHGHIILRLPSSAPLLPSPSPSQLPLPQSRHYTVSSIITDGCFLHQPTLESMLQRLRTKQNLILQGPPGTGKTWLAKRLAYALIGRKDESKVRPMQFHPNLSYEDFVRGWRPQGDGKLTLLDGPFLQLVEEAKDNPDDDFVMVIEEINRGNPASIFGEMLTLLEADKRTPAEALALAYPRKPGERVYIPPNVYVIGTMNLADRSLAMVDLALRRRFAFFDLEPMLNDTWREWVNEQCGIDDGFLAGVAQRIDALNEEIAADRNLGRQFRIGHSFVTPPTGTSIEDPDEWFEQVVETEIVPLLHEYWFDDPDRVSQARSNLLGVA